MITSIFADLDKVFGDLQNAMGGITASYKVETTPEGDIILRKDKEQDELIKLNKEISEYIDKMDDEIFAAASYAMEQKDPENTKILASIDNVDDVESIKKAFESFKGFVKQCAADRIAAIEKVAKERIDKIKTQYNI